MFLRLYGEHMIIIVESNGERYTVKLRKPVEAASRLHGVLIVVSRLVSVEIISLGISAVSVFNYRVPVENGLLIEDINGHLCGILPVFIEIVLLFIIHHVVVPTCIGAVGRTVYPAGRCAHIYTRAIALENKTRLCARACKPVGKVRRKHNAVAVVLE